MTSVAADQDQAFYDDNDANLARLNQITTPLLTFTFISLYPVDFLLSHLIVPLRGLLTVRTWNVLFARGANLPTSLMQRGPHGI